MSEWRPSLQALAVSGPALLLVAALVLSGCGDGAKPAAGQAKDGGAASAAGKGGKGAPPPPEVGVVTAAIGSLGLVT